MRQILDQLTDGRLLWRGAECTASGITTGFPDLDKALPGGGWPLGAVMEITASHWGIGELRLLLPLMRSLSDAGSFIIWILPPYEPYAPALDRAGLPPESVLILYPDEQGDALWCAERLLRSDHCGMLLLWPDKLSAVSVRRLQLAAEAGGNLGIVLRTPHHRFAWDASPAALRLHLQPALDGELTIEIVKARGSSRRAGVTVRV